jgi:DNA-binding NarL/FixJ family response regulator
MELPAARRLGYERAVAAAREAVGEAAFATAWADGRRLSVDHILAEVLASTGEDAVEAPVSATIAPAREQGANLSRREREVLTLLAEGHSDREIAATLFISRRTASSHVAAILGKLGTRSRAEAAVRAVRDGMV